MKHAWHLRAVFAGVALVVATGPAFAQESEAEPLTLTLGEGGVAFIDALAGENPAPHRLELELAADGGPLDVAIAQHFSAGETGAAERRGAGAELRIGRGLVERGEAGDSVYVFMAADDEALTWAPGGMALREQVELGDVAAGIALERNGVQAALAYVERDATAHVGAESFSRQERFVGVTLTMRR